MGQDIPQLLADDLTELKERVALIESEIPGLQNRNRRVESNKTWGTGRFRLLSITGITYVTMVLVFLVLGSTPFFGRPGADHWNLPFHFVAFVSPETFRETFV